MILKKFVPGVLVTFILISTASSQVKTNFSALREAALRSEIKYQEMSARVAAMARLHNWPLFITLKRGNQAVLYGISAKGMPLYVVTNDNIISAATIGTNQLWPGGSTGLGLSGSDPVLSGKIAIWDGGRVLATHQELTGRVIQKDNPPALNDHSTHVSGTLIASGVNPVARGMSFGAPLLKAYDFNNHLTEMYAEAPNLLISNHSYGELAGWNFDTDKNRWEFLGNAGDSADYKFGYYDDQTQVWDSIAYNAPYYLIVKSVGNNRDVNGPAVGQPYWRYNSLGNMVSAGNRPAGISNNDAFDIIPTYGTAKNIISIGAIKSIPGGYVSPADVLLASFSSWGPTDDGRIKPDLVADGIEVLSCISTSNNAYAIYSGTSMSSPAAAGSAFLLQQYYHRLHNQFMRSATLKGILIHTADEAGPADGPDYQYGYGLIDMPKAASVITSNNTDQLIQENVMANGDAPYSFPVIASGKGPLVVTLSWTDPAGSVNPAQVINDPTPKLVNDLDLRVTGNSTTYTPWVLNPLIPWNPATHGDDNLNNLEKIQVPNTIPGATYTITVSHKGNLRSGSQAYSLIASGVGSNAYCASAASSTAGTRIDQLTISNLNVVNPTGCTSYTNYTNQTINLQTNQTLPFSIKLSSCDLTTASRVVKIFIDYNNDGNFTDPGETVNVSPVLAGGAITYGGNLNIPAGMVTGNSTIMRIVVQETTDPNQVNPCGNYPNGETQDYTVTFVALSNDVGMGAVVDPLPGSCQTDSQRISVRIKNAGTNAQVNVPIQLKVLSGSNTLVNEMTVCPDTIPALGSVVYTFQAAYRAVTGNTYIIQAATLLSGDQNISNNAISDTIKVGAGSETITAEAEICNTNPSTVGLKANTRDQSDAVSWFDSPTSVTPIATGIKANTTNITANKTYYMGLNEISEAVGPKNKYQFPNGGYNYFQGNFIRFHNDVPLTIATTRLYVGAGGKVKFTVADLASFDSCTGGYSYYPISSNTVDLYATTSNPSRTPSSINSPLDTGAVFLLNLAVPTPGNHVLIVIAEDSAFLFRNNGIKSNPYPMGLPGIFTFTGNSAINTANCKDTAFYQGYYYFLYDTRITLDKCASPRVAVVAQPPTPATIILVGNVLTSNYTSGNQWYIGDSLIAGSAGQQDTFSVRGTAVYKDVINDSIGCSQTVFYNYTPGNDIGFSLTSNPNHGAFTVRFYLSQTADANMRVLDINGRKLYESDNPNFQGSYNQVINLGVVSSGMYILQLEVGSKRYIQKFIVR